MIISLTETKTLLQITSSAYDSLINMLIPIVESTIVDYCNNEFVDVYNAINGILPTVYAYLSTTSFAASDNSINDSSEDFTTKNFKANDSIRVYNSLHNDKSFTISSVAAHKIILNSIDTVKDESAGNTIVFCRLAYPLALKFTASQMIKWGLQKQGILFKSEKIDDYSYTREDNLIMGYPSQIMSTLNDYRSLYKKTIPFNLLYYRTV